MPTATNPAKRLMSSFKELGLTAVQVRRLMPGWWDDAAAENEGGLLELQILLARRLNVAIDSLQADRPKPRFRETVQRFKTVHPEGSSQLAVAASIGQGLAQLVGSVSADLPLPGVIDAQQVRSEVLKTSPAVTLQTLCAWSWRIGIPVVHVRGWPTGLRRPDAMCMRVGSRPVVMVVRNEQAPAKLTYLVAHELGHVLLGHLRDVGNAVLVDDALPVDKQQSFHDEDERQADAFAMEVLGGSSLLQAAKSLQGRSFSELTLTVAAFEAAKGRQLDAGQVILGWGRLSEDWRTANMALRYLMHSAPAPEVINQAAKSAFDLSLLSAEGKDHLAQLTGMEFDAS